MAIPAVNVGVESGSDNHLVDRRKFARCGLMDARTVNLLMDARDPPETCRLGWAIEQGLSLSASAAAAAVEV
eukprot:4272034-Heterocapsa_arctica.AAC.1